MWGNNYQGTRASGLMKKLFEMVRDISRLKTEKPTVTSYMRTCQSYGAGRKLQNWINLNSMPNSVMWCVIAGEDKQFLSHRGFSLRGYRRALMRFLKERAVISGGSTITQQVFRNMFLTSERTVQRKLLELAGSIILEGLLSKKRILELYLNIAEFGENMWGIQEAARGYLDLSVHDLCFEHAVFLISLLPAPTRILTGRNLDRVLFKQHDVLRHLRNENIITTAEFSRLLVAVTSHYDQLYHGVPPVLSYGPSRKRVVEPNVKNPFQ